MHQKSVWIAHTDGADVVCADALVYNEVGGLKAVEYVAHVCKVFRGHLRRFLRLCHVGCLLMFCLTYHVCLFV